MKISKSLHLTTEVNGDDVKVFVHSAPISTEVYDQHWKVLARTFAEVHNGFAMNGARVAHRILAETAKGLGIDTKGLMAEIRRLTNVAVITDKGMETMPFDDAVSSGLIDAESANEVEGKLVFFTAGWHGYTRETRQEFLTEALRPWNAQVSASNFTDYSNSAKTLMKAEDSGKPVT